MKVLFPFVGDSVGGSHVATCLLIQNLLTESEFQPLVILHQTGPLENYLSRYNIPYKIMTKGKIVKEDRFYIQIMNIFKNIKVLGTFIKNNDVDVVHTNDLRMHYTWIFPSFFQRNSHHIWHQHSHTSSWRLAFLSFFTIRALTISEYCKSSLPYFFRIKTEVIYNPFCRPKPKKLSDGCVRKILNLSNDDKIIGFVGNFTAQKRPNFFIDCAEMIFKKREEIKNYHFVLIGEREPMNTLLKERIHKLGLESNIHILGPCFPIEPYIRDMDVLIAPAINEGLGRVLIEAMFYETLVVASNDGGHKEIIKHGETGLLIHPNSPDDFCEATLEILKNVERKNNIVKNAKQAASEKFSDVIYFRKVIDTYLAVCSNKEK